MRIGRSRRRSLASERPYFISDSGDNPTAGGAGDASYMLQRLLAHRIADVGACDRDLGKRRRSLGGRAVHRRGRRRDACEFASAVRSVRHRARWRFAGSRSDRPSRSRRRRHRRRRIGGVRAIVTTRRKPYHFVRDLRLLDSTRAAVDLTVVKIGYLVPDLFAAAKGMGPCAHAGRRRSGHRPSRSSPPGASDLSASTRT